MPRFALMSFALLSVLPACVGWAEDKAKKPDQQEKRANAALRFDVDRLMKDHDANHDGFLDRKEVPPFLLDNFDFLDANKDGKLSREEIEKGSLSLQPRRRPSDFVFILIEMSDCDDDCTGEVQ